MLETLDLCVIGLNILLFIENFLKLHKYTKDRNLGGRLTPKLSESTTEQRLAGRM